MAHRNTVAATLVLATWIASPLFATAPAAQSATIVFDANVREFTCWREGPLTEDARLNPCKTDFDWHPVTGEMYFLRNQPLSLLLVGAVVNDLVALDVKADDLTEPGVPVLGGLTDLPKLQAIPPAPGVVLGPNVKLASKTPTVSPSVIYRLLTTADAKSLKATLQGTLIDPFASKEVSDLLAVDVDTALALLHANTKSFCDDATALSTDLSKLNAPTSAKTLTAAARALSLDLDKAASIRNRLVAEGVAASGKIIGDAVASLRVQPVQRALEVDSVAFTMVRTKYMQAFPIDQRYSRVAAIAMSGDAFVVGDGGAAKTDMKDFLDALNAAAPRPLPKTSLATLKENLGVFADIWPDLYNAETRSALLTRYQVDLLQEKQKADGVFALQLALNAMAGEAIKQATLLNHAARTLALDDAYGVIPVGVWYSSKTITITVKMGQRVALFDVSGVSDSSRASVIGTDAPASKSTQTGPADPASNRSIQFPIYNVYHFELAIGAAYSSADDDAFQVAAVTTTTGSTTTTQEYFRQTRSRDYTLLWTANVVWFPAGRHAFPWRARYCGEKEPSVLADFGSMIGFGLGSPTKDFVVGAAWCPRSSPVGLQLGWHIALRDYPPDGTDMTKPITDPTVTLKQKRLNGVTAGVVFTTDFFAKTFGAVFKP